MSSNSSYVGLAQRIADAFSEMESEITVDSRENSEAYVALYQKISSLKAAHPIIL